MADEHAGVNVHFFESVLNGQRVDNRGEHTHMVGRNAVKAFSTGFDSPKYVSAANHNRDLHAQVVDILDFGGNARNHVGIDTEALIAHQGFATQFQQDTIVLGRHRWFIRPMLLRLLLPDRWIAFRDLRRS